MLLASSSSSIDQSSAKQNLNCYQNFAMWFRKSFRNRKLKSKLKGDDGDQLIKSKVPDLLVNLDSFDCPPPFSRRYGNIEELSEKFSDVYDMSTLTTYQSELSIAEDAPQKVVMRERSRPQSLISMRLSSHFDDEHYQTMKIPEFNPYSKSYYSYHHLARDRYISSQKRQSKEINRMSGISDIDQNYEEKPAKKTIARTRSLSARGSTFKGIEGIINTIRRRPSQRVETISKPIVNKRVLSMPPDFAESDTILHSASSNGQVDIARFYAESNRYVNHQNKYLNTPLHCAVYSGHVNIVEILLKSNADTDIQNIEGDTPLHIAISNNSVDIAEVLMDHSFNFDIQNENGDTALHIAAFKQFNGILQSLIERKADLLIQNNRGNTPLHICLHGSTDPEVFQYLIESATVNNNNNVHEIYARRQNSEQCESGENSVNKDFKSLSKLFIDNVIGSAIEHLILKGYRYIDNRKAIADTLRKDLKSNVTKTETEFKKDKLQRIENDVEPLNLCNNKGDALIHRAVKYCDVKIVEILLTNNNIKKDLKNADGDTILHLATKIGSLNAVKLILQHQRNLIDVTDCHGNTPLHCAIAKENIPIIQFLISKHCNVNVKNRLGNTPLHVAILIRRFDILKLLLELPNVESIHKNIDGNLPLHCAILTGNINIIQAVKEISENCINETNNAEENVLHVLLQCKNISYGEIDVLMKYLIESKVDFNKQDRLKNTVLHLCIERKLSHTVNYILTLPNVKVDLQNLAGDTALHLMAKSNNVDALNKVNCEGWVFDITNNNNETPLDIALELSLTAMAESIMKKKWGFSFPM